LVSNCTAYGWVHIWAFMWSTTSIAAIFYEIVGCSTYLCRDFKYKILSISVQWFLNYKMRAYFFSYLKNHKCIGHKMCFIVLYKFYLKHSKKCLTSYTRELLKCMQVFTWSVCYCWLILSWIGMDWQMLVKHHNIKCQENLFSSSQVQTDMVSHGTASRHIICNFSLWTHQNLIGHQLQKVLSYTILWSCWTKYMKKLW
jgi:hypothetical protein